MTERERRLTDHLAEKVCKLSWAGSRDFNPIRRPDDCDLVMEAWRQSEHTMLLELDNASRTYTATADYGEPNAGASNPSESWTKAVCEAIADASGYVREGK